MTALKINRFSFSEIEDVTIRCAKCGAGHVVKIDSERFSASQCPSCGEPYGKMASDVFRLLQDMCAGMAIARASFSVEFDIVEKE